VVQGKSFNRDLTREASFRGEVELCYRRVERHSLAKRYRAGEGEPQKSNQKEAAVEPTKGTSDTKA